MIEEWTTTLRYQPYNEWDQDYLKKLEKTVKESRWHLKYHVQPVSGLLNDPNGFSYFDGKWQLFYQAYPMGPVHGVKSWYHVTSDNLVDWKNQGLKLLPDTDFDSHGVYSGSAIPINNHLLLAYTGNVRGENRERKSYQMAAFMDTDYKISKAEHPLIAEPPVGYTHEFRDPQIFQYEGAYFILMGAQTEAEVGKVLVYKSQDSQQWTCLGELSFSQHKLGYMIECPNLVFIDGQPVLLFCPQGLRKDHLTYQNIYPNTYLVADYFNSQTVALENPSEIKNLDNGFDVYATQAFNAPDGRALAVSWIGLPELAYPTDQEGWAHCLSIVKELTLKDGQLYQNPVAEQALLRGNQHSFTGTLGEKAELIAGNQDNSYELQIEIAKNTQGSLHLFADNGLNTSLVISFDTKNGTLIVNRERVGTSFASEYGNTRELDLPIECLLNLQVFVDHSVCEIFVNDGQHVLTSRVFPNQEETHLFVEGKTGEYSGSFWRLRGMKE